VRWKTRSKTNSNDHSVIIITCLIWIPSLLPPWFGSSRWVSFKLVHGCPKVFHKYASGAVPPPRPYSPPPPPPTTHHLGLCIDHARPTSGRAYDTYQQHVREWQVFSVAVLVQGSYIRSKYRTSTSRPSIVARNSQRWHRRRASTRCDYRR
jgi:hypothetical protein